MRWIPRSTAVLMIAAAGWISTSAPATATPPTRVPSTPFSLGTLPAGVACVFPISIDLVSGDQGQSFTFFDQHGNVVRAMGTATQSTWQVTNLATGKTQTVQLPAGLERLTASPDGTTTVVISGGAIGFNAPTDTPPGPFSFANSGRLVLTVDTNGNTTLLSVKGTQEDLCAAVA